MRSKNSVRVLGIGLLLAVAGCTGEGSGGEAGTPPRYSLGVTISGLVGSGLQLANGDETLPVPANGPSTFATRLPSGTVYSVSVLAQPTIPAQTCSVVNGSGTIAGSDITDVAVVCVASTAARFAYSLNFGDGSLHVYNVDAASGQLRLRGYAKTGAGPSMILHDAAGKFTYVLNSGVDPRPPVTVLPSSVSVFAHDNVNGDLREVEGSPFVTTSEQVPAGATFMAVHRSGNFVFVTNSLEDVVRQWRVTAEGGLTLIPGEPVQTGSDPSQLVFDPRGRFAYVTNRGSSDLYVYELDLATGALQEREPLRTKISARASRLMTFAFHPSGKFAYVVSQERDSASGSLAAFTVDAATGRLTAVDGAPYELPANPLPVPLQFHPGGRFAYAPAFGASGSPQSIAAFVIDAATGALRSVTGSPYAGGIGAGNLILAPSGKFLYLAGEGASVRDNISSPGAISAFSIDATTGVLTPVLGIETLQPAPRIVSIDPSGHYLYAVSTLSDRLYTYRIDATTGALAAVPHGAVMRTGHEPISIDAFVSPTVAAPATFKPGFAYLADQGGLSISAYAINAGTGLFTPHGTRPTGAPPRALAPAQDGRFLYSLQPAHPGSVAAYSIEPGTGNLIEIEAGAVPAPALSAAIATDPSRRFAYVASNAQATLTAYRLDAKSGRLAANGPAIPTIAAPLAIAIDPTGRNLYAMSSAEIQAFSIDAASGTPSALATADHGVKSLVTARGTHLAVEPGGKFLYVASRDCSVERYSIDARSGALGAVSRQITERCGHHAAIEPGGRFLYAADAQVQSISAFSIDPLSGELTPLGFADAPSGARRLAADFSGRYLHALLFDNTVAGFAIDRRSGQLSALANNNLVSGIDVVDLVTVGSVQ